MDPIRVTLSPPAFFKFLGSRADHRAPDMAGSRLAGVSELFDTSCRLVWSLDYGCLQKAFKLPYYSCDHYCRTQSPLEMTFDQVPINTLTLKVPYLWRLLTYRRKLAMSVFDIRLKGPSRVCVFHISEFSSLPYSLVCLNTESINKLPHICLILFFSPLVSFFKLTVLFVVAFPSQTLTISVPWADILFIVVFIPRWAWPLLLFFWIICAKGHADVIILCGALIVASLWHLIR